MPELAAASVLAAPAPSGVTKKKFAAPPVKSACLAWTRECVYLPSRRGGPRSRKKPRQDQEVKDEEAKQIPDDIFAMLSQEPANAPRDPISIQNYIDPGAGLKHLEDWVQDSDFIFDSLFMNSTGPIGDGGFRSDVSGAETPSPAVPMVRTYQSDAEILDAYYVFIHPYFPILPPPVHIRVDQPVCRLQNQLDVFEGRYEPSSPITLALSAILALVPCAEDANHQSHESQLFRRKYAQFLAQSAFETIESDEEIPDSAIEPPRALSEEHRHPFRRPFHPQVPLELERIIALALLSVYEYAQRGNLKKMQNRAGQALMSAMELSLQSCTVQDEFTEARRRVWWMSYICAAQGAIVNNANPTFPMVCPSYTAGFPTILADSEAFPIFIQAQRAILAATQFVIELNKAVKEKADMTPIHARMKEIEAYLDPLLSRSETWLLPSTTTSPVDVTEEVVARSLRCMASIKLNSARIKVHRYCAFFDIPVFSRKHCDLKSSSASDNGDEPRRWPTCSCSSAFLPANPYAATATATASVATPTGSSCHSAGLSPTSSEGTGHYTSTSTSASTTSSSGPQPPLPPPPPPQQQQQPQQQQYTSNPATTPTSVSAPTVVLNFPFSSHHSAKVCLKSALNIARAFDDLPYPSPTGMPLPQGLPAYLSPTSAIVCPRTMPSFACCAMQCAYALLMVYQKTKTLYPAFPPPAAAAPAAEGPGNNGGASGGGGIGGGSRPVAVNSLLARLQQGLTSIYNTLANYATAFEALGGMRDQIRSAVEGSAAFVVG